MTGRRKRQVLNYKQLANGGIQKRVIYVNNSTQTTPPPIKKRELRVVIKRLPQQIFFNERNEVDDMLQDHELAKSLGKPTSDILNEEKDEPSEQLPASVSILKRPDVLYRLPSNYQNFVKPITNNENANSTIASLSLDKERENDGTNVICRKCPRRMSVCRNFIKPGPRCSKPPTYFLEDNRFPVMLDDSHTNEDTASPTLSPIIERTNECTSIHEEKIFSAEKSIALELNNVVNITTEEAPIDVQAFKENTVSVPNLNDLNSNTNKEGNEEPEIAEDRNGEDVIAEDANEEVGDQTGEEPPRIENVRFSYQNYTTLVIPREDNRNESDTISNTDRGSRSKKRRKRNRKKYIVIEADTVHIHNHFYNR